ncbi:MAG TPA: hypothetical protein VHP38_08470 [Ruminiclostridium sp.]|nr:hypothetical protein [Ruminiclostridium sp.]
MNKFISLTKINLLTALLQMNLIRRRAANKHGTALISMVAIMLLAMLAYAGWLAFKISSFLNPIGLEWIVLVALLFLITFFVFSTSLYTVSSVLFESADTEQLFAYPIPKYQILFSKVLGLVVENWIFALVLALPFIFAYGYYVHPAIIFYFYSLISIIISPLVPLCLIAIISYIVSVLTSGTQFKNYFNLILTIAMVIGITNGITNSAKQLQNSSLSSATILDSLKTYYPPVGYAASALYKNNPLDMLIAVAWNVVPFILLCGILSMFYASLRSRIVATKKVKGGKLTFGTSSKLSALTKKEFARFLYSPMYILNSCIGIILITIFSILSKGPGKSLKGLMSALSALGASSTQIVLITFLLILSTANITAPSISLEGKNLWILKSLPVNPRDVLMAKLALHTLTLLPFLIINCIIVAFTMNTDISGFFIVLISCTLFVVIGGMVGLIYNLHFHRFDFINDMQVVKNSASVLLTLITQLITVAATIFIYWSINQFVACNFYVYAVTLMVIAFWVTIYLYHYLCTKGKELFLQLE